mgnify:FL=1
MSDWQLQQEYLDVQFELSEKQTKYNTSTFNTASPINNYATVASYFIPNLGTYNLAVQSTISASEGIKLKDDIATLSERLNELGLEMSKRGIYSPWLIFTHHSKSRTAWALINVFLGKERLV